MTQQATIFEKLQAITHRQLMTIVIDLLQWSEEQYSTYLYETGLAYLEAYFGKDQEAANKLSGRRQFWSWFKNHWTFRDQSFCETFLLDEETPLQAKLEIYYGLHNAGILACEIYPNKFALGHDFPIIKMEMSC